MTYEELVATVKSQADTIAALRAENAELLKRGDNAFVRLGEMLAENERLREALKRIADGPWPDEIDSAEAQCKFDERIARAALGEKGK